MFIKWNTIALRHRSNPDRHTGPLTELELKSDDEDLFVSSSSSEDDECKDEDDGSGNDSDSDSGDLDQDSPVSGIDADADMGAAVDSATYAHCVVPLGLPVMQDARQPSSSPASPSPPDSPLASSLSVATITDLEPVSVGVAGPQPAKRTWTLQEKLDMDSRVY